MLGAAYVQLVVDSITDDPIRLREPRYTKSRRAQKARSPRVDPSRASRWCSTTTTPSIMCRSGAMSRRRCASARSWPSSTPQACSRRCRPSATPTGISARCMTGGWSTTSARPASWPGPKKSIYPYVFPTRNPARAPKDETVLAGYYCIDTFTPAQPERLSRRALGGRLRADRGGAGAGRRRSRLRSGAAARPPRRDAHLRRLLLFQQCGDRRQSACRATAGSPSSTSTITMATASRRSSTRAPTC